MSFGSELSSVRGLGGGGSFGDSVQADISLADTINREFRVHQIHYID